MAVRILRIGQQISHPPFWVSGYGPGQTGDDVCKNEWLRGHMLFANRSADTVRSLPSDRRLTVADNNRQTRRTGTNRLSGHGP